MALDSRQRYWASAKSWEGCVRIVILRRSVWNRAPSGHSRTVFLARGLIWFWKRCSISCSVFGLTGGYTREWKKWCHMDWTTCLVKAVSVVRSFQLDWNMSAERQPGNRDWVLRISPTSNCLKVEGTSTPSRLLPSG